MSYDGGQREQTLAAMVDKWTGVGEPLKEAEARFELGRYLFQLGRGESAFTELRRSAELFQNHDASPLAAQALLGCAHALTIVGRVEESLEWFDKSIGLFKEIGLTSGELEASAAKLEALLDLQRWNGADLSNKIIMLSENDSDPQTRVFRLVAFQYQAQERLAAQDLKGSLAPAMKAADLANGVGNTGIEVKLRLFAAHNLRLLKRLPDAADQYRRVIKLAQGVPGAASFEEQAIIGLGEVLDG
ncbi:hypothetical protein PV355_05545 [Streptomyces stelliscabiei]|uniref:tetratricopeptide repeat protein n=1 Tax=Streptomyces stelliscabiei TaxID=146820 RepID=UPI0029BDFE49|nr:hypothetical protein [Streptomyces stelliscabiei]MDX2514610.1 hypothetical protein [Streptomyces stelliscabiei]